MCSCHSTKLYPQHSKSFTALASGTREAQRGPHRDEKPQPQAGPGTGVDGDSEVLRRCALDVADLNVHVAVVDCLLAGNLRFGPKPNQDTWQSASHPPFPS
jgi:hypothetical protein